MIEKEFLEENSALSVSMLRKTIVEIVEQRVDSLLQESYISNSPYYLKIDLKPQFEMFCTKAGEMWEEKSILTEFYNVLGYISKKYETLGKWQVKYLDKKNFLLGFK